MTICYPPLIVITITTTRSSSSSSSTAVDNAAAVFICTVEQTYLDFEGRVPAVPNNLLLPNFTFLP